MSNTFFIADIHLGHEATCTSFVNKMTGEPLRPYRNADEMDEEIIKNWNSTVSKNDKVYIVGDVTLRKKHLDKVGRLNGDKVLIGGNHDVYGAPEYLKYFRDVRSVHVHDKFVVTHVPVHPQCLYRWRGNIHGHLHDMVVMGNSGIDPRYICVSIEQPWMDFRPIAYEELKKVIIQRGLNIEDHISGF